MLTTAPPGGGFFLRGVGSGTSRCQFLQFGQFLRLVASLINGVTKATTMPSREKGGRGRGGHGADLC